MSKATVSRSDFLLVCSPLCLCSLPCLSSHRLSPSCLVYTPKQLQSTSSHKKHIDYGKHRRQHYRPTRYGKRKPEHIWAVWNEIVYFSLMIIYAAFINQVIRCHIKVTMVSHDLPLEMASYIKSMKLNLWQYFLSRSHVVFKYSIYCILNI